MRHCPSFAIPCRSFQFYLLRRSWPHLYSIFSILPRRVHPFTCYRLRLLGLALYCHGLQRRLPAHSHSLPPSAFFSPIHYPPCSGVFPNHFI
ncbi:vacuolar protein [Cryptococcus neoformans A2-102-5]|nr:vacuolar protein [Cryptococcus neoformans var. grubii D17-1]OXG91105.1 vacuolar protein [Cryptococcus neoformans var. grubii A2-102-5]